MSTLDQAPGGSARPLILAFDAENTFVHVSESDRELLDHPEIGAGGASVSSLEFFDTDGRRLAGVYKAWELVGLVPTADPPDTAAVRRRVDAVFAHLRSAVLGHPEVLTRFSLTAPTVLAQFRTADSPDLRTALGWMLEGADLRPAAGGDTGSAPEHNGSTWHNLTAHGHF
jgi:hypothetical protein